MAMMYTPTPVGAGEIGVGCILEIVPSPGEMRKVESCDTDEERKWGEDLMSILDQVLVAGTKMITYRTRDKYYLTAGC